MNFQISNALQTYVVFIGTWPRDFSKISVPVTMPIDRKSLTKATLDQISPREVSLDAKDA